MCNYYSSSSIGRFEFHIKVFQLDFNQVLKYKGYPYIIADLPIPRELWDF